MLNVSTASINCCALLELRGCSASLNMWWTLKIVSPPQRARCGTRFMEICFRIRYIGSQMYCRSRTFLTVYVGQHIKVFAFSGISVIPFPAVLHSGWTSLALVLVQYVTILYTALRCLSWSILSEIFFMFLASAFECHKDKVCFTMLLSYCVVTYLTTNKRWVMSKSVVGMRLRRSWSKTTVESVEIPHPLWTSQWDSTPSRKTSCPHGALYL